jgi:ABC-type sugar transport system substrate-binding protein
MTRKRTFAAAAAVACVVVSVAVVANASFAARQKTFTIAWVPPTVAPFEVALRAGIKIQAKALGMKVVVAGGQFDPNSQLTAVQAVLQRNPDALLIWPLDPKALQPALDKARNAHIPAFVIDSPTAKPYTANFQTDDFGTMSQIARYAATKVSKPCTVAIIEGRPGVPIIDARNAGLIAGAKAAGCTILDKQVSLKDSIDDARTIAGAWRTKYGSKLKIILGGADTYAMGALAASNADFHPVITGINGDSANIAAIRKGLIAATASLLSPEIGNGLAYAAYLALTGKSVPSEINVRYGLVTRENVGQYKSYDERLKKPMKVSFSKIGGKVYLETS